MRKSRFREEQIAYALRQVEQGTPATELCRKLGISEQTFYTWKKRFAVRAWPSSSVCASSRRKTRG